MSRLTLTIVLVSVLLSALVPTGVALGKPVDLSRSIEPGGAVRVDIAFGQIRVVGSQPGRVRVSGEIDDRLRRATLGRDGGAVEVRVRYPLATRLRSLWAGEPLYQVDLTVEVPPDTRLFVVSRAAHLEIEGVTGPIGVGTVSGDVIVRGAPASLDVETVSGSLDFVGRTARLEASSMSGRLSARAIEGEARVETVTGAIDLQGDGRLRASLTTVSGEVVLGGALAAGGGISIVTESGDVTLACCGSGGLEVDLLTHDGEIVNEVSRSGAVYDDRGRRRLQVEIEGGGALAEVRTRSGLVRLVRAGA